ncbi:MAG: peptidoglycan DD-metalloendopeptidase family protein [Bacteroidetes bacterium]|nr:peptidoglycan DD-metalloendopeptidase family protein [Bacteroidota bacterium]
MHPLLGGADGPMELLNTLMILGPALCLGAARPCLAQSGGPQAAEEVSAVVVYGDDKLVDGGDPLTDDRLQELLDSLCGLDPAPDDLIRDLQFYKRFRHMDDEGMTALIDSLFELEEVPYALVNEINLYTSQLPLQADVDRSAVLAWSPEVARPGAELYGEWITTRPNPYGPELSARDTLLQIKLVDDALNADFAMPVPPIVTSRFGWRDGRAHNGVDLDLEVMDPVRSAFPGVVRFAGVAGGFGRLVVVRHYNGLETYYAHLHRIKVQSGDVVDAGMMVGYGGSSGHSTGSHLHFETRFKGVPIDPSHIIDLTAGRLLCDTLVLKKTRWSYAAYPKGTRFHTVKEGEHLSAIAELYGTSLKSICQLNGLTPRSRLRVGQHLMVADLPDDPAGPASGRMAQVR